MELGCEMTSLPRALPQSNDFKLGSGDQKAGRDGTISGRVVDVDACQLILRAASCIYLPPEPKQNEGDDPGRFCDPWTR